MHQIVVCGVLAGFQPRLADKAHKSHRASCVAACEFGGPVVHIIHEHMGCWHAGGHEGANDAANQTGIVLPLVYLEMALLFESSANGSPS